MNINIRGFCFLRSMNYKLQKWRGKDGWVVVVKSELLTPDLHLSYYGQEKPGNP